MKVKRSLAIWVATSFMTFFPFVEGAKADSLSAYCTYTPNGESQPSVSMPCVFSQRQGYVDISWDDGVVSSFEPVEGRVGTYLDQRGGWVYRQRGRDGADLAFKMEAGDVLVYWGGVRADDYAP